MEEAQLQDTLISLLLLLAILYYINIFSKNRNTKLPPPPPSPPSFPIIGHLHLRKQLKPHSLQALSEKYGKIISFRFGIKKYVVVSSPSAVEECFKTNNIVFSNRARTIFHKHLGYNYTTMFALSYGDLFRNLRRLLAVEMFSTNHLAKTTYVRQQEVQLLVNDLVQSFKRGTRKVELKSKFSQHVFNIISMKVLGKRCYGNNVEDAEQASCFLGFMEEIDKVFSTPVLGDFLPVLRWLDFQGVEKRMIKFKSTVDQFLQNLVDEQRIKRSMYQATGNHDLTNKPIIDTLLDAQEKEPETYTEEVIKGNIMILLMAGISTTSITMEWAMSQLLNHPKAMEKVKAEIDDKVGKQRMLEEEDLSKLTYLQNVIKETLRLCNTVPLLVPHAASRDCQVGGFHIECGTIMLVNTIAMHKDRGVWENPTEFKPERFESWDSEREGFKLVPFGGGRRSCPGEALANRILGLTLGTLIQRFEWEAVDGRPVDMSENMGSNVIKRVPLEAMFKSRPD